MSLITKRKKRRMRRRGSGCGRNEGSAVLSKERAANTGGGPQDRSSRWGHEKFEANKEGFNRGNKDSSSRATGSGRDLKQSDTREVINRSRTLDDREKPRGEHSRREETRSRRHINDEPEGGSGDRSRRPRRHGDNDEVEARSSEEHHRREEKRFGRHESGSEDRDRGVGDKFSTQHGGPSSQRDRER